MPETTDQELDITQLEAKIKQLIAERLDARDNVISIEHQLEMQNIEIGTLAASKEQKVWFARARFALAKERQKVDTLSRQIGKLNTMIKETKERVSMAESAIRKKDMHRAFLLNAKSSLPPEIFDAILEQTIQQVGGS
jgi:hypothetical protein